MRPRANPHRASASAAPHTTKRNLHLLFGLGINLKSGCSASAARQAVGTPPGSCGRLAHRCAAPAVHRLALWTGQSAIAGAINYAASRSTDEITEGSILLSRGGSILVSAKGVGGASWWFAWLSLLMLVASPLICKLNPFPPNRRRPLWGLLPGPTGAGFRSCTGAGKARPRTFGSPWRHARSTPSAGRCISQNWHRFGVQSNWRSLGPVSFGFGAASPSSHPRCLCPAPWPWQAGGSRTLRLTRAQPDTCITKACANSKPPPKGS